MTKFVRVIGVTHFPSARCALPGVRATHISGVYIQLTGKQTTRFSHSGRGSACAGRKRACICSQDQSCKSNSCGSCTSIFTTTILHLFVCHATPPPATAPLMRLSPSDSSSEQSSSQPPEQQSEFESALDPDQYDPYNPYSYAGHSAETSEDGGHAVTIFVVSCLRSYSYCLRTAFDEPVRTPSRL